MELLNKDKLIIRIKENLLSKLNGNDLYAMLLNIQYVDNGVLKGTSPISSVVITATKYMDIFSSYYFIIMK